LNDLEFKTQALIRRNFGTDHYYYDYRYASGHPAPTVAGRVKAFFGERRSQKR
jgi:hypothetical protein